MAARKKQARKAPAKKAANKPASVPVGMSAQEAKWRAEEVKGDRKRLAAAKRMAQQKAKEAAAVAKKVK